MHVHERGDCRHGTGPLRQRPNMEVSMLLTLKRHTRYLTLSLLAAGALALGACGTPDNLPTGGTGSSTAVAATPSDTANAPTAVAGQPTTAAESPTPTISATATDIAAATASTTATAETPGATASPTT